MVAAACEDLWRVLADAEHARLGALQGSYLEEPPRVLLSAYHFILLVLSREDAGPQVGAIVHLHASPLWDANAIVVCASAAWT